MTYCKERTQLLADAGRTVAMELLPKPFVLWHSNHDTGCQMTIVLPVEGSQPLPVWKGSIWHSGRYEFNDNGDIPGYQPDFDFAKPAIEKYFAAVAEAVEKQKQMYAAANVARSKREAEAKQTALDEARRQLCQ